MDDDEEDNLPLAKRRRISDSSDSSSSCDSSKKVDRASSDDEPVVMKKIAGASKSSIPCRTPSVSPQRSDEELLDTSSSSTEALSIKSRNRRQTCRICHKVRNDLHACSTD